MSKQHLRLQVAEHGLAGVDCLWTLLCLLFLLVWWAGRWARAACLGPAFVGGGVFLPPLLLWGIWVGFPRRSSCFPASGGGLAYGALDQRTSLSLIDAGSGQPPAFFLSFLS